MNLFGNAIFTPRLKLRRITPEDLEILVAWSRDRSACGEYLTPDELTEESSRSMLAGGVLWTDKSKMFMIETRDTMPLGTIHFWVRPEDAGCAVVKVRISLPEERGKGYGTEAQKYLVINLFDRMKLKTVEMYTDVNNKAQQRCLVKLGFDLVDSLSYDDRQVSRFGHLFRLSASAYAQHPVYRYHYE